MAAAAAAVVVVDCRRNSFISYMKAYAYKSLIISVRLYPAPKKNSIYIYIIIFVIFFSEHKYIYLCLKCIQFHSVKLIFRSLIWTCVLVRVCVRNPWFKHFCVSFIYWTWEINNCIRKLWCLWAWACACARVCLSTTIWTVSVKQRCIWVKSNAFQTSKGEQTRRVSNKTHGWVFFSSSVCRSRSLLPSQSFHTQ